MHETAKHFIEAGWLGNVDAQTRDMFLGLCRANLEPQGWDHWATPPEPMFDRGQMLELASLAKTLAA